MSKSNFYVSKIFYNLLEESELSKKINGSILRELRPIGSEKEDIVIKTGEIKQNAPCQAQVTLSIYLKEQFAKVKDYAPQSVPPTKRFEELCELIFIATEQSASYGCIVDFLGQKIDKKSDLYVCDLFFNVLIYNI